MAHVIKTCDPNKYAYAQGQPKWEIAMNAKIYSLLKN